MPVYNKNFNRCEACPAGYIWNATSRVCQKWCPEYQILDFEKNQCVDICNRSRGFTYNNETKKCDYICKPGTFYNISSQKCESICDNEHFYNLTT